MKYFAHSIEQRGLVLRANPAEEKSTGKRQAGFAFGNIKVAFYSMLATKHRCTWITSRLFLAHYRRGFIKWKWPHPLGRPERNKRNNSSAPRVLSSIIIHRQRRCVMLGNKKGSPRTKEGEWRIVSGKLRTMYSY